MARYLKSILISILSIVIAISVILFVPERLKLNAEVSIEIYSIEDLDAVRQNLTASYVLMNDLDFDNPASWEDYATNQDIINNATTGWAPIGVSAAASFEGFFDGNGHTISNLFINRPTTTMVGLFGVSKGMIKDIGLVGVDIKGSTYVGALVGYNYGGTISTSYSTGTVAGNLLSSITYVGGLVGRTDAGLITNSYSIAAAAGYRYVGGFVGYISTTTIFDCYSAGLVTGTTNLGGFSGYTLSSTVRDAFWDTETSTKATSTSGTGKTTAEMKALVTYQTLWNIVDISNPNPYIWYIDDGVDYPRLTTLIDPDTYLTKTGDYYEIGSVADLQILNEYSVIPGFKYRLTSNLDLTSNPDFYIPVFIGEFEGDGYDISNLFLNLGSTNYLGLFGTLWKGGVINNVEVLNVSITGSSNIGGIVGYNYGTISNSNSTGDISGVSYLGGITGYNSSSATISDSHFSGTISGTSYIGGLTGRNYGIIGDSYSVSTLTGGTYTKGLIGNNETTGIVTNSFYDSDGTTINGVSMFAIDALEQPVFDDWVTGGLTFDLTQYFTQEGEYNLISSIADLTILRSFGWDSTLKFKLTTDIDLTSVPGFYVPFLNGEFDGAGYEISNLYLDTPTQSNVGLFGTATGVAQIKNLGVVGAYVNGTNSVGALAGLATNVINSYVTNATIVGTGFNLGILGGATSSPDYYTNSYYNYDTTTLNGAKFYTPQALDQTRFDDWLANGLTLDITDYLTLDGEYYIIDSVADIEALRNFGGDDTLKVKLTTDLDLTSNPGLYIPVFSGEFEGSGYEISNLSINLPLQNNIGFIGYLEDGGKVNGLGIVNATVVGKDNVGGLVGYISRAQIYNSYTTGAVSGTNYIGSLAGYSHYGKVLYSYSSASATASANYVGGLIGYNYYGLVHVTYSTGSVQGTVGNVGGLVGYNYTGEIYDSYSQSSVNGGSTLGGLIGYNYSSGSKVDRSYSSGAVTGGSTYKGGLIGRSTATTTVTNSFWDTTTSTVATSSGGTGKTTAVMKAYATFSDTATVGLTKPWIILPSTNPAASIWSIDEGNAYPIIKVIGLSTTDYFVQDTGYSLIDTLEKLKWMSYGFPHHSLEKFKLTADLDLVGDAGFYTPYFSSELDGNSHTITNLAISITTGINLGFFGELWGDGVVKNLGLTNVDILGDEYLGALVGSNYGTIDNCYSTGTVEGIDWIVGGLVGKSDHASITNSYSTATVTAPDWLGGLVGYTFSGTITGSHWEGTIVGSNDHVGGLVGYNESCYISDSYSAGTVTGMGWSTGGLVGYNTFSMGEDGYSTITGSYSTAVVTGVESVGGLVGYHEAGSIDQPTVIIDSYATGAVSCSGEYNEGIGGLVGTNDEGFIQDSYSTGNVTCNSATADKYYIGGLVGTNYGFIVNSYADGNVDTGGGTADSIGGFAGYTCCGGSINKSFATGSVIGGDNTGGFVGSNDMNISNSYALGSVTGTNGVGGFVGNHDGEIINNAYSTGTVAGSSSIGGFSGTHLGTITNSFWDTTTSSIATSSAGTGKTTFVMKNISTFNNTATEGLDTAWDIIPMSSFDPLDPGIWYIDETVTYPLLAFQNPEYVGEGTGGEEDPPVEVAPQIDPDSVTSTNITSEAASLNANLTSLGSYESVVVYFEYRTGTGDWLSTPEETRNSTGIFTHQISSLNPNTIYEFRTVIEYGVSGIDTGTAETFTTLQLVIPKVVLTKIGTLTDIADIDSMTQYLPDELFNIQGVAYRNTTVKFETDTLSFQTVADNDGNFQVTITLPRGTSVLDYYAYNNFGSQSPIRELTMVIGTENYPQWLRDLLGLDYIEESEDLSDPIVLYRDLETSEDDTEEEIVVPEEETPTSYEEVVVPIDEVETPQEERESVFEGVERIFRNIIDTLSNVDIGEGIATSVAVGGYILASSTYVTANLITFKGTHSPTLLQFLSSFLVIGRLKKKKQKYGIVYDSVTKEPINLATVRVLDELNKLVTTVVTDVYGVFDLNIPDGNYKFEVVSKDHIFPSKVVLGNNDDPYQNVYKGGVIYYSVDNVLNISIPMDKESKTFIERSLASGRSLALSALSILVRILFVIGFGFTLLVYAQEPNTFSLVLIILYLLSIAILVYLTIKEAKSYGLVRMVTGNPVKGLEIGLKNLEFDTLHSKRISNDDGKYRFIIPGGRYELVLLNSNYELVNLRNDTFEVPDGKLYIINEDLIVRRV